MGRVCIIAALFLIILGPVMAMPVAAQDSAPVTAPDVSPVPQQASEPAAPAEAGEGQAGAVPAVTPAEPPATEANRNPSGLPIPRFVTLASDKVFVRTGPALRYPIKWVYLRNDLPIEVIQEFDTWRKVRDMDGDDGWVHQSLLSGQRAVIVKGEQNLPLYAEAAENSRIQSYLEPGVVALVKGCAGSWCELEAQGYSGYAQRKFLWGIYDAEDFN